MRRLPIPEEAAFEALLVLIVQYDELGHLFVYHHEYHHRNRCNDDDEKAEAKVSKSQQKSAKVSKRELPPYAPVAIASPLPLYPVLRS